ncbi:uncharacterized protein LOC120092940 isoform X2 [Benincasa hispida]|uniref:uncharacterized protein LOC120092940 isoform X2 n=1 Tax=Benincasa hispida TaxID=102211 RepID=UPI001900E51C|nr:uncharacterized protein LOC120092940 isoform X2 [Benincasa hispida]
MLKVVAVARPTTHSRSQPSDREATPYRSFSVRPAVSPISIARHSAPVAAMVVVGSILGKFSVIVGVSPDLVVLDLSLGNCWSGCPVGSRSFSTSFSKLGVWEQVRLKLQLWNLDPRLFHSKEKINLLVILGLSLRFHLT